MYCNTTSKVKYSGVFSNNFECNLGVRQGEGLSPFLFNLFLNDIEAALESGGFRGVSMSDITIRALLYADDLLLMPDSTEDLQLGIDILYDCCTRWKLNVNFEKSAVVIFRKGGSLSINDHYFSGDTLLTVTNTYSNLSMTGVNLMYYKKTLRIVVLGLFLSCIKICIIYTILKNISNVNYLIKLLYQSVTTGVRCGDFIKPLL